MDPLHRACSERLGIFEREAAAHLASCVLGLQGGAASLLFPRPAIIWLGVAICPGCRPSGGLPGSTCELAAACDGLLRPGACKVHPSNAPLPCCRRRSEKSKRQERLVRGWVGSVLSPSAGCPEREKRKEKGKDTPASPWVENTILQSVSRVESSRLLLLPTSRQSHRRATAAVYNKSGRRENNRRSDSRAAVATVRAHASSQDAAPVGRDSTGQLPAPPKLADHCRPTSGASPGMGNPGSWHGLPPPPRTTAGKELEGSSSPPSSEPVVSPCLHLSDVDRAALVRRHPKRILLEPSRPSRPSKPPANRLDDSVPVGCAMAAWASPLWADGQAGRHTEAEARPEAHITSRRRLTPLLVPRPGGLAIGRLQRNVVPLHRIISFTTCALAVSPAA